MIAVATDVAMRAVEAGTTAALEAIARVRGAVIEIEEEEAAGDDSDK